MKTWDPWQSQHHREKCALGWMPSCPLSGLVTRGCQAAHMTWLHGELFAPPVGRENKSAGKRVSAGMPTDPGEGALLALSPHSFLGDLGVW